MKKTALLLTFSSLLILSATTATSYAAKNKLKENKVLCQGTELKEGTCMEHYQNTGECEGHYIKWAHDYNQCAKSIEYPDYCLISTSCKPPK